jgi:DNA repair exonuclease SbcCD nuclease subunit
MKIALINDTHFGARSDSQLFFDYFMKFFDEVFFPYLIKNNIKTIIHAGDLMDRRKFVNFNILNQVREKFIERLENEGIEMHCILGNHDVYYRNTNRVNSVSELFGDSPAISVHEEPTVESFGALDIALLPWVNKENYNDSINFIKNAAAPLLVGHLELDGYQVMRGINHVGGMHPDIFDRYEKVLSGHFHCRQDMGNIYYLGTQYQITFSDLGEKKGFHVLDTNTRDIEFIENPNNMFHRLLYNDENGPIDAGSLNFSTLDRCYVRVDVLNKNHPYSFDRYMDKLYECGAAKVTTVEDYDCSNDNEDEMVDLAQDTVTIINDEIDTLEEIQDKDRMKRLIKDLYMESLSL